MCAAALGVFLFTYCFSSVHT